MTICLACGAESTRKILDFGPQAAANLLPEVPNAPVKRVPLALRFCDTCGHAQQNSFYPPNELFGHYLYQSGTTTTLSDFFDWLALGIAKSLPSDGRVLELASNDGSFLAAMGRAGVTATGIEPASNLVALSRERGHHVIEGYWPNARPNGKFDRIIGMNVLAHGPDPLGFLRGVRDSLTDSGIACIQVSQADMFRNFEFDTLYHEHYSFFCPASLGALARRAGFTHSAFCKTGVHGGSIMALLGFEASPIDSLAADLTQGPFALGTLSGADRPSSAAADAFSNRAAQTCASVATLGRIAREAGRPFVLVGAAAKAITVLQASGIRVDAAIDEAPLKIGRYIPDTRLKIGSFADSNTFDDRCLFLIGAWNFRCEIEEKLRSIRGRRNDLSATYFPSLRIADLFDSSRIENASPHRATVD